jgi:hypothetical protein
MTTPKQKASLLILTYMAMGVRKDQAKEYALAAVEFAREEFKVHCAAEIGTDGTPDDHFNTIKQEIENL